MIRTTSKTVTTTPASIATSSAMGDVPKQVIVQVPTGGQTVFVGGVTRTGAEPAIGGASYTLTTANGVSLASPSTTTFNLYQGDELYAVVAATTQAIIVYENQSN